MAKTIRQRTTEALKAAFRDKYKDAPDVTIILWDNILSGGKRAWYIPSDGNHGFMSDMSAKENIILMQQTFLNMGFTDVTLNSTAQELANYDPTTKVDIPSGPSKYKYKPRPQIHVQEYVLTPVI